MSAGSGRLSARRASVHARSRGVTRGKCAMWIVSPRRGASGHVLAIERLLSLPMVATYSPVRLNDSPMIARRWSPWITQSCGRWREPFSGRDDQMRILGSLPIWPVTMVSFHRPAPELLGHAAPLGGRAHAYQPRFFSDMGYCSDSRGRWGHGHPLEHPAVAEGRAASRA